ncbi:MAG: hypothetical protein RL077_6518 [Verrucomicrobiota bacterium]|jgi:hypothetical protein
MIVEKSWRGPSGVETAASHRRSVDETVKLLEIISKTNILVCV